MNEQTIQYLINLNKEFYSNISQDFSNTRSTPWKGWGRVIEVLHTDKNLNNLNVLDIGCGNGRFGAFLFDKYKNNINSYTGIDTSTELMDIARSRLGEHRNVKLINAEVFTKLFSLKEKYDLVCAFGLTHHIPSRKLRSEWFTNLGSLVEDAGYIATSFWNFDKLENLFNTKDSADTAKELELEENDYLISWNKRKDIKRYCHLYSKEELVEINNIMKNKGFYTVEEFYADGRTDNLNLYKIWKRE